MAKYYVYNRGKGIPTHTHETYEEAETEAKRLAAKEGCYFEVLQALSIVEPVIKYNISHYAEEAK